MDERFFNEQVKLTNIKLKELEKILTQHKNENLQYQWLYDILKAWEASLKKSCLFLQDDIEQLLPSLLVFLSNIFNKDDETDLPETMTTLKESLMNNLSCFYISYQICKWDCLKMYFELNNTNSGESNVKTGECNFVGEKCFEMFTKKMNYIIDMLIPNEFQFKLYCLSFGPNGLFKCEEVDFPFNLIFPRTYLGTKKSSASSEQKGCCCIKKDEVKDTLCLSVLPLCYSNEAKSNDFWLSLEKGSDLDIMEEIHSTLTGTDSSVKTFKSAEFAFGK